MDPALPKARLMAVCGHCWLCSRKLDCGEKNNCGDCVADQLTYYNKVAIPPARVLIAHTRHEMPDGSIVVQSSERKICARCVDEVNSGSVSALIDALRSRPL